MRQSVISEDCVRLSAGVDISINTTCRGITDGLPTMENAITMFSKWSISVNNNYYAYLQVNICQYT